MAASRPLRRAPLPGWVIPVAALGALLLALASVVWLSQRVGTEDAPPPPPPFAPPASANDVMVYTVKQVNGETVVLVGEKREGEQQPVERELRLAPGVPVEVMRPASTRDIRPGEALNITAIPNEVRNFSVHSVVVLPGGATRYVDGILLSAAGFAGHEAALDQRDRPALSGQVVSVAGDRVVVAGPAGEAVITLAATAPLYRLAAGSAADIREGDRIALAGASGHPRALLVLQLP